MRLNYCKIKVTTFTLF